MWRAFAYLVVPIGTLSAIGGAILGVWAILDGDYKDAGAIFAFVAFWSWGALSAYKHEIKKPREERKRLCAQASQELAGFVKSGAAIAETIEEVRIKFPVIGPARHRSSSDSIFDTAIELETKDFTIWLFAKDGAIGAWEVR